MASTTQKSAQGKGTGLARRAGNGETYLFGSKAEVAHRANPMGEKAHQFHPSAFNVIPGGSSGKSLLDPQFETRGGSMKFSLGPDA